MNGLEILLEDRIECPDLPEWLESADIKAREGKSALIPAHLTSLLSLYRRSYSQNYEAAELLAERYETGDLPCGASLTEAIKWHTYSADLGSVKSALRLARLHTWLSTASVAVWLNQALLRQLQIRLKENTLVSRI